MKTYDLPPRTGNQYTIRHNDYEATITQLGATLRRFTWRNTDIVVPLGADDLISCCHGQILIPFPNRVADATYQFEGVTYTLPIDEHERKTALHGYGYRAYWELLSCTTNQVSLVWRAPNMNGYPFDIVTVATWQLDDQGIHLTLSTSNHGANNAPWAAAIHPWLCNGLQGYGDEIDALNAQCRLRLPAKTHVCVNDYLIPIGTENVEGTRFDLRNNPLLVNQPFDDAWTDLDRDDSGWTTATFTRADGLQINVQGDTSITSFQVCTGTGFPANQHPCGVAVEPQTAYANAFNTGTDLTIIPPEATVVNEFRISPIVASDKR